MSSLPPMPLLSMSTKEVIGHCKSLKDCEDGRKTLFIASYPKSGTTWMQAIIYNILTDGNQDFKHISEYSPFYEIEKTWNLSAGAIQDRYNERHKNLGWRVFNTHLRWNMLPKEPNMRYIYVVRNGKDVVLSFFQHLSNQDDADCFQGTLVEFVEQWCDGKIPFGNWLHHLQSWMEAYKSQVAESGKILLVRYEDMTHEPLDTLKRIIVHMGLNISDQRAQEILHYVSFDYMKAHQTQYMPISVPWKEGYSFIRNGKVGDSKNFFTEEHDAVYERMIQRIRDENNGNLPDWLAELEVV